MVRTQASWQGLGAAGIAVLGGLIGLALPGRTAPRADTPSPTPVLVELFTSEGCSSCPPADAVLAQLQATQPVPGAQIVALGEHVDYWNRLGWKDPYSSAAFSARQNEYAQAFHSDQVYTPQMVVNGQTEFVGSDRRAAEDAILRAAHQPHASVRIAPQAEGSFSVQVTDLPKGAGAADIYAAVTESGLSSNVSRGENAGRRLTHAAVVRHLEHIGTLSTASTYQGRVSAATKPGTTVRIVVFVQERDTRHILGVAERSYSAQ